MICCDCVQQVLHITTVMYEVTLNLLFLITLNEGLVWGQDETLLHMYVE